MSARRSRRPTTTTVLAAGALGMVGAQASAAQAATFYDPPATLPAANGALVRSEPLPLGLAVSLPGTGIKIPGSATRIMYRSTDVAGQPVAVTGAYLEPQTRWTGRGPRPLVSFAEGTQGQGDQCAPSRGLEKPLARSLASGTIVAYEVPIIYELLRRGAAVTVTDYVGLGTSDRFHTYLNRVDQGRAVLDAARAALALPRTSITSASPIGLYGYSQGGGAAAAAAELAPSYAPELGLRAAYVGAPPADLVAVLKSIEGGSQTGLTGFVVNSLAQAYPGLRPVLAGALNETGKAAVARIGGQCVGDVLENFAFQQTSQWTVSGQTVPDLLAQTPSTRAALEAQRIGSARPSVPVRIATGTQDDVVPHDQVKALAKEWCGRGASVTYVPIPQPLPRSGLGINHITPVLQDSSAAQRWLLDRLAGSAAASNCAAVPTLP